MSQDPPQDNRPPWAKVLGVAVVAVGVGVIGAFALDLHSHQCDQCGKRWWHLGSFNVGDKTAHTCAMCGDVQWWKGSVAPGMRQRFNSTGHDAHLLPSVPRIGNPLPPASTPLTNGFSPPPPFSPETPKISADTVAMVPSKHYPR